jgi:hypothetical protein
MGKDPRALIYSVAGFVAGIFVMWRGFHWFKRKRLIEDIPTSKVRAIAMGLVEIQGKARQATKEIIRAPLSGKKCVHYKYVVEKRVQSGKSSHWKIISRGYNPDPFYLEDNTGKVMVEPKYADMHIPKSHQSSSSWGKDPGAQVKSFLKKESIKFEGALFGANYTMRYTEWIITPGMQLYVMGTAADNPYVENATSVHGVEDAIIKKGSDGILMISNRKEKQVLNKIKWKAIGYLAGGFLLSLVCLIIIIAFLSLL